MPNLFQHPLHIEYGEQQLTVIPNLFRNLCLEILRQALNDQLFYIRHSKVEILKQVQDDTMIIVYPYLGCTLGLDSEEVYLTSNLVDGILHLV